MLWIHCSFILCTSWLQPITSAAEAGLQPKVASPAEVVFLDGKFYPTVRPTESFKALAVRDGVIIAVGTDEEMTPYIGPNTKTVRLQGHTIIPGIYDSHVHWLGGGLQLARVELKDAENEAEFGKRIREFVYKLPRDRWLQGGNWDHEFTFAGKLPDAKLLDQYTGQRPAYLTRYDAHMALANSAALKLAGITSETNDPPGGVIERGPDGKTPTGILKDAAMALVSSMIPDPSDEEIFEAVRAALRAAAEQGVTSVQDMEGSTPAVRAKLLRVLKQLEQRNELTCRVALRFPIAVQADIPTANLSPSSFVEIAGIKGYMDGSLGSSTAKMYERYLNLDTRGVYVTEPNVMKNLITRADKAGYSCAIHAIGDEANGVLLDLYEQVAQLNGQRDRRFRIEHAQHLRPQDLERFKQLNVIASMQPYHIVDDGVWAEGRIGAKRCETSYAYRDLLDRGATLAFGSDWPVAPLNPWIGLDAAVNRRTRDGKNPEGWFPKQRITVSEALRAYTLGSALAGHHETSRGTLEVGKVADFVAVDLDLFDENNKDRLAEAKAVLTVSAGRMVYERTRK